MGRKRKVQEVEELEDDMDFYHESGTGDEYYQEEKPKKLKKEKPKKKEKVKEDEDVYKEKELEREKQIESEKKRKTEYFDESCDASIFPMKEGKNFIF